MRAAAQRSIVRFEPQRRNARDFLQRSRIVEEQVLPRIAQESDRARRIDGDPVTGGDALVVFDFVCVGVVRWIVQKQAYSGHPFQTVDAVAIECDVKGVRITLHQEITFSSYKTLSE